jgi:hypothetical protein
MLGAAVVVIQRKEHLMRASLGPICLSLCIALGTAQAQQAPTAATTYSSEPGRAAVADAVKMVVVVTAVDPATRGLTLKAADGKTYDMVAGNEVRNFDQIKVNDRVVVQYVRGLTLELRKGGAVRPSGESTDAARAKRGEKPGAVVRDRVTVMADVVDVNEKDKTISLRGPKGNVVVLDVQNPEHFKVVKKGDQVEAEYVEALAVAVEPASVK